MEKRPSLNDLRGVLKVELLCEEFIFYELKPHCYFIAGSLLETADGMVKTHAVSFANCLDVECVELLV